jgi:molybdopterin synthase catalytic subunit
MIQLTKGPICFETVMHCVHDIDCGASVLFVGTTRRWTNDTQTLKLAYEAHEEMAIKVLQQLEQHARTNWPIKHVAIVHRLGEVGVGEASVAVAVSSPHREASFQAAKWLIDTLKQDVPIWKQDFNVDGQGNWQHPSEATS